MKKLSLLLFCSFCLVMQMFAYSFEEGGIYYNITSSTNMTVSVTYGKEKYEGWRVIPETVLHEGERYYVTAIGSSAFAGCTNLYSISFAANTHVKSIGNSAFSGCNSLSGITIPASVTSIDNYAFSGCMILRNVEIEDSNTTLSLGYGSMNGSDYGLFADCPLTRFYCGRPLSYNTNYGYSPIANQLYLDDIVFGENVTTISPYMFYNNFAITNITLPETITALGNHAFDGLRGLKSFTIPEHITSIGDYAFANCTELTSFTIPEWITSIGAGTFSNCYGLTSFTIGSGVTTIGDYAFSGCSRLTSFSIPNNVNSIGNYAFKNCIGIKSLKIEKSKEVDKVKLALGYGAKDGPSYGLFYDCPLETVDIEREISYQTSYYSSSSTYWSNRSPFRDHPTLKKVKLGKDITYIYDYLFYQARYLEEVSLPNTAETIGNSTFYGCESLASLSIPASVTTIKDYAFANCTEFISFTFGNNLNSIGNYVFFGCTGIKSLKFEKGKEIDKVDLTLGYGAKDGPGLGLFYDCPLETVDIEREISYQTSYYSSSSTYWSNRSPFRDHPTLKKVTIGDEVTYINDCLLYQAKYLEEVNLPSTAETIGHSTFYGCESLASISIPASVTTFKDYAFANCTGFTSFTFGNNLTSIGNYVFSGCTGIKSLKFEKGKEIDKVDLTLGYGAKDGPGLGLFYDCPLETVDIEREISYQTSYYSSSSTYWSNRSPFRDHPTLKKAAIGEEITYIYDNLFYQAKHLERVYLPNTAATIGKSTFYGCESLTSISIPASVTTFKDYAFANCTGFTSFTFGNNLTSIGNYVFSGCTGIKSLKFEKGKEIDKVDLTLGYGAKDGPGLGLFYDCPLETVDIEREISYQTSYYSSSSTYWSNSSPFRDHPTLKKITIGDEVTYINDCLLYQAKYLEEVSLPNTAETIGNSTFYGCESLASISFPASVTTIKDYAFANCTGFTSLIFKPSVTSIGNYAFNGCTALSQLTFEEGEETLSLGYNFRDGNNSNNLGRGLFNDCPLESVFIGRNLSYSTEKRCGYSPFANIGTLVKARLGNPVKSIQPYLFSGCGSFTTLNYNENCAPTSVDSYAFWGCTSLTESDINLPESVKTIGEGAFGYCTSLEGYSIPNHVTGVGDYAFMNCEKLANVIVKPSVTSIGNYAFNGCTALSQLTIEEGEETLTLGYNFRDGNSNNLGKGLFNDCPLESVFIGRNLSYNTEKRCGYSPFAYIDTFVKARLGNPVKAIPSYLFCNCKSFTTLNYNENCAPTSVGSYAFFGCEAVTSLSLPESIETIGEYAFSDCSQLGGLIFHPALKSIGNYAFRNCTTFNNFTFEESEQTLTLGNGSSEGEKTALFKDCPLTSVFIGRDLSYNYSPLFDIKTLEEARFGNPVTRIPNYIFQGDTELSSVVFNNSCQLQSVGKYAFDGCLNLAAPQFPNSVTAFDEGAFKGCTNFMNFELPENLATIGSYTFQDCTGLTEFNFPATMTSIGSYAFSGCTSVKEISFADSEGTLALGYGASKGKGYGLFSDCPLEELYLGKTVSYDVNTNGTYGYSPFYKQEALESITVGPKVTALPYCIFWGTAMEELYIPSSVRTLHSSFANNCPNLKKIIILGATPPATDTNNTMLSNSAEDSRFYVFFPDKYKATKIWKDYADKIDACCEIYSNLTYGGDKHLIAYQTDFPIVLDNMETEAVDAGTYQKRIDVTYTTNDYTLKDVLDFEYTIKKALLTITPQSCTREYGDENPEFKFEYDGFASGEDEKVLTKDPIAITQATIKSIVGDYDIIASGAEAKNYEIQYGKGTLTIAKAPLTITAKSYSIRQGEALPQYELEFDGFKNNETKNVLSKQPRITCEASSVSLPGTYDIIVSGAESYNYNISHVNGTLTISPYKKGDVNNDGYIDVADLTGVVHFILNESTANLVFESADLDENGAVEINDYAALVKVILGGQNNNSFMARRSPANMENLISLTSDEEGEILVSLLKDRQFTGMQFDLMLPDGVTLAENGAESESPQHGCWSVRCEDGRYRILCSSMSNAELHKSLVIRLKTNGHANGVASACNVVLSDTNSTRHEAAPAETLMGNATYITQVEGDNLIIKTGKGTMSLLSGKDRTVIIYGVNGAVIREVELTAGETNTIKLPVGIYIANSKKVIVR